MHTYKILLSGQSATVVLAPIRKDMFSFLSERDLDISDYITDWDNEMNVPDHMKPFPPNEWWNGDYGSRSEGILLNNDNSICVEDENYKTVWESVLNQDDLKKEIKNVDLDSTENVDDFPLDTLVFIGEAYEGSTYSYEIETNQPFTPSKLSVIYSNVNGNELITSISYDDGEVVNEESDTTNKGTDLRIEKSKGKRPHNPHNFSLSELTPWFDIKTLPSKKGFYEVKKCDEQVATELMKWNGKKFLKQVEEHKYDKNWNIKSTKLVDQEVPFYDIESWRGLKNN